MWGLIVLTILASILQVCTVQGNLVLRNAVTIHTPRDLALNTKSPTPESSSPTPSDFVTAAPTLFPANATFSADNGKAIATLVGSTLPFVGLGALFLGLYMRNSRSLENRKLPSDKIDDSTPYDRKKLPGHISTRNPQFQINPMNDVEADARPPSPPSPEEDPTGIRQQHTSQTPTQDKRKTMGSLMNMVLRSRQTAAFYNSPLEEGEHESGLSKDEIAAKVKRIAAAGSVAFGAATNGINFKTVGDSLPQLKPDISESLVKPSEVLRRDSAVPGPSAQRLNEGPFASSSAPNILGPHTRRQSATSQDNTGDYDTFDLSQATSSTSLLEGSKENANLPNSPFLKSANRSESPTDSGPRGSVVDLQTPQNSQSRLTLAAFPARLRTASEASTTNAPKVPPPPGY